MCVHLYVYDGASSVSLRASFARRVLGKEKERRVRPYFFSLPSARCVGHFAVTGLICAAHFLRSRPPVTLYPRDEAQLSRRATSLSSLSLRSGEFPFSSLPLTQLGVAALVPADYSSNGERDQRSTRCRCRRQVALTNWKLIQSDRALASLSVVWTGCERRASTNDARSCSETHSHPEIHSRDPFMRLSRNAATFRIRLQSNRLTFLKYACWNDANFLTYHRFRPFGMRTFCSNSNNIGPVNSSHRNNSPSDTSQDYRIEILRISLN